MSKHTLNGRRRKVIKTSGFISKPHMCPKLPPTAQPVPPLSREPHCTSRHLQTNHRNQNYFNKGSSQSLMNDEAPALTWSVKSVCDFRYFRKRNLFQLYVFSVFISYLRKYEKSRTLFLWVKSQGEDHRIVWSGIMVDTGSLTPLKGYLWTMSFPRKLVAKWPSRRGCDSNPLSGLWRLRWAYQKQRLCGELFLYAYRTGNY